MSNMTNNIISLVEKTGDNLFQNPETALKNALGRLSNSGKDDVFNECNKMLIIALNDNNENYDFSVEASNLRHNELAFLCDLVSTHFKSLMLPSITEE